ncbi:hypothetical protein WDW86_09520, partial [Bdellovibrionota bacterium FG-2]
MKKNAVYLFLLGVILSIIGVLFFIQSAAFAPIFKGVVTRLLPVDSGIDGDFEGLSIKIFPPGFRVIKPSVVLRERNILRLPSGSRLRAESVDLGFLPFQMLTGSIRIHSVQVVGADIRLDLTQSIESPASKEKKIHLDEFLNFQVDSLAVERTQVGLVLPDSVGAVDFKINKAQLEQRVVKNGKKGFALFSDLSTLKSEKLSALGVSIPMEALQIEAQVEADRVEISKLELRGGAPGDAHVEAAGVISGNLFDPKTLTLDLDTKLEADLLALKEPLMKLGLGKTLPGGGLYWTGKVHGNLLEFPRYGSVQGQISLKNLRFKSWEADQVSVNGGWLGAKGGGFLAIEKGLIQSPERARVGGNQPGGGGRIEIGAFKVPVNNPAKEPIEIPLKLSRAHLHWLAGPVTRELYPLDVRASGEVNLSVQKGSERSAPWLVMARVDLAATDLQLDNQRLGKVKALRWILKVSHVQINGEVAIDADAVRMRGPSGVSLSLGETHLNVGGEVNFKDGFDLKASGPVNLSDIGAIAQKPISGKGSLKLHVHGPTSKVFLDFDPDLKDASYLGLYLGDLKGRITWDDDPSHLIFSDVQAKKGRTSYLGKG